MSAKSKQSLTLISEQGSYLDRIKQIKSQRKITNEELAAATGIPLGTLSKLLAGIHDSPRMSSMVAICQALDCSLDYIVLGIPVNTHNATLNEEEMQLITSYRAVDAYGQTLVRSILRLEEERTRSQQSEQELAIRQAERAALHRAASRRRVPRQRQETVLPPPEERVAQLLPLPEEEVIGEAVALSHRSILLYDLPVSAGTGEFLSEDSGNRIRIPDDPRTAKADYALRVSGNSMEPEYRNGDILLVQRADTVATGELGIFLLDGCGYFKQYGGDCLISLNTSYAPIPLKDYASAVCCGKVVGRMRRKQA